MKKFFIFLLFSSLYINGETMINIKPATMVKRNLQEEELLEKIKVGGIYQHYSGSKYKVLFVARDSEDRTEAEDLELLVIYQDLGSSESFGQNPIWVRKLSKFIEEIEKNGVKQPRFKFVEMPQE